MAVGMTKITLARFTRVYLYNYVIQWDIFLTLNFVKTNVMGIIHHDALILSNYHNSHNNTKQLKLIYNIVFFPNHKSEEERTPLRLHPTLYSPWYRHGNVLHSVVMRRSADQTP